MARILPGSALTGSKGRIGDLVTYDLNGIQVVRTLPDISKKKSSSRLQNQHLRSFKVQHAIARSIKKTIIDRIWTHLPLSGGMNPYNQFLKRNRVAYGDTEYIEFPELMMLSDGSLLPAKRFIARKEGENLVFSWENNPSGKPEQLNNRLNIVILEYRSSLRIIDTDARRSDGQAPVAFFRGGNSLAEGYAFWSSENEDSFSPSVYWVCR
ncbi:MAG TPA: hypothetical protein VIH57_08105 [Bacteroidales bacterium]